MSVTSAPHAAFKIRKNQGMNPPSFEGFEGRRKFSLAGFT
jgi:hypothetical protein